MLYHIKFETTVTMDLYEWWKEHRPKNQNDFGVELYMLHNTFTHIHITSPH